MTKPLFKTRAHRSLLPVGILIAACAAGPAFSVVTLPSGHAFKVVAKGPMMGPKGELGLVLSYLSDTEDQSALQANADELVETVKSEAETGRHPAIIIMSNHVVSSLGGLLTRSHGFNVVFERDGAGIWRRQGPAPPGHP